MSNSELTNCLCGKPGKPVRVQTIPGSFDSKITIVAICDECYERDGWAEIDLDLAPRQMMFPADFFKEIKYD